MHSSILRSSAISALRVCTTDAHAIAHLNCEVGEKEPSSAWMDGLQCTTISPNESLLAGGEEMIMVRTCRNLMCICRLTPNADGYRSQAGESRCVRLILFVTCQVMLSVTYRVYVESELVCAESRSWKHGHSVDGLMARTDDKRDKKSEEAEKEVLRCCCIALAEAGVHEGCYVCFRAKRFAHRDLMGAIGNGACLLAAGVQEASKQSQGGEGRDGTATAT
jgi:hypothetical protein